MTPEDLIGPAAAKALAEHFVLTPKAKPLPEVVTQEEFVAFQHDWYRGDETSSDKAALSAFVCRWLRARLAALPSPDRYADLAWAERGRYDLHRAATFKALTGRDW